MSECGARDCYNEAIESVGEEDFCGKHVEAYYDLRKQGRVHEVALSILCD